MDLFARELLFPRPLARRWHLNEGLWPPPKSADRLQAPYDLVAVQLFDALFLPPVPAVKTKPTKSKDLNPRANEMQPSISVDPLLVKSGPRDGQNANLGGKD